MFCQDCGTPINEGNVCQCGFDPSKKEQPQAAHGYQPTAGQAANDFINSVTTRFSVNHLVILGGCILLFIFLFLPFTSIVIRLFGITERASTSGFNLMFGDEGSFGNFLLFLVPILAVAGLSFAKFKESKGAVLAVAFMATYINLAMMINLSNVLTSPGFGIILSFIVWLAVTAAAYMDFKGINVLNNLVKK